MRISPLGNHAGELSFHGSVVSRLLIEKPSPRNEFGAGSDPLPYKGEGVLFYEFPLLSEERNKVRSSLKNIRISE
jgi:hypothetical protein